MNASDHGLPNSPQEIASPSSSPAISDAIERLLAHPELLSSVASAIGLGKPSTEKEVPPVQEVAQETAPIAQTNASLPATPPPSAELAQTVAAIAPLVSAFSGKGDLGAKANDPRSCLLRALKPYVSHNRAQAIDTILQLSLVSEAFKKLNEKGG